MVEFTASPQEAPFPTHVTLSAPLDPYSWQATNIAIYGGNGYVQSQCWDGTQACGTITSVNDLVIGPFDTGPVIETFKACGPVNCRTVDVTRTWELKPKITSLGANGNGGVSVAIANDSETGWIPPSQELVIWDVNRNTRANLTSSGTGVLSIYPTPTSTRFQARVLGTKDHETRTLAVGNTLTFSGDGTGDGTSGGGGTGGGGGDDGPPPPPTAQLTGEPSYTLPDGPDITLSPSESTGYPYEIVAKDTTDGNRIVGSCFASTTCDIRLNPDADARQPVVHRLITETRLGNDVVKTGQSMDVYVNPYPVRALIKSIDIRPAPTISLSAGIADVKIANIEPRPFGGYRIYLRVRSLETQDAPWEYAGDCGDRR